MSEEISAARRWRSASNSRSFALSAASALARALSLARSALRASATRSTSAAPVLPIAPGSAAASPTVPLRRKKTDSPGMPAITSGRSRYSRAKGPSTSIDPSVRSTRQSKPNSATAAAGRQAVWSSDTAVSASTWPSTTRRRTVSVSNGPETRPSPARQYHCRRSLAFFAGMAGDGG